MDTRSWRTLTPDEYRTWAANMWSNIIRIRQLRWDFSQRWWFKRNVEARYAVPLTNEMYRSLFEFDSSEYP